MFQLVDARPDPVRDAFEVENVATLRHHDDVHGLVLVLLRLEIANANAALVVKRVLELLALFLNHLSLDVFMHSLLSVFNPFLFVVDLQIHKLVAHCRLHKLLFIRWRHVSSPLNYVVNQADQNYGPDDSKAGQDDHLHRRAHRHANKLELLALKRQLVFYADLVQLVAGKDRASEVGRVVSECDLAVAEL